MVEAIEVEQRGPTLLERVRQPQWDRFADSQPRGDTRLHLKSADKLPPSSHT